MRPLLFGYDGGSGVLGASNAVLVGFFFTIYILLTQVVLQNVVVAVLLDKFVTEDKAEEEEEEEEAPAPSPRELRRMQAAEEKRERRRLATQAEP